MNEWILAGYDDSFSRIICVVGENEVACDHGGEALAFPTESSAVFYTIQNKYDRKYWKPCPLSDYLVSRIMET